MKRTLALLTTYDNIPHEQRDIFLADPHKLFELSNNLNVVKNNYMEVETEEFEEVFQSPDQEVVVERMQYIKKLQDYATEHLGLVPPPVAPAVPAAPPITLEDLSVEFPFVVIKSHYEQSYEMIYNGVGHCGTALHQIRNQVTDLPGVLDIGQGNTFFTGNEGILHLLQRLSNSHTPMECAPIFRQLHVKCPQLKPYIDINWASQPGFFDGAPTYVELFANVATSLQEIQAGVELASLVAQFI